MPNRLDLPPELNSLIEKREQEDRRKQDVDAQRGSTEDTEQAEQPSTERRSGEDRRANES